MKLPYIPSDRFKVPARGLLQNIIDIQDLDLPIVVSDIRPLFDSNTGAKVFLVRAERERLLLRGERGKYYPVSPQVALLSSLLPQYYRTLWRTHDILERCGAVHAFACLSTASLADYAPSRPIVALSMDDFPRFSKADVFGLMLDIEEMQSITMVTAFEWPEGTHAFEVPELDQVWSALLLGAIGLPREVAAARRLLEGLRNLGEAANRRLNAFGLSPRKDVLEKEVAVNVPAHFEEMRARYAEALRQQEVREGGAIG